MMKLLIFGNKHQENKLDGILRMFDILCKTQVDVSVEKGFHDYLSGLLGEATPHVRVFNAEQLPQADVAISLGGDGTFLATVMWVAQRGLPILGINSGHLGYLTATSLDQSEEAIRRLMSGDYTIEPRTMLQVAGSDIDTPHPFALNEIAILRQDTSSMIEMDTRLRGTLLTTYKGDGLVVSTPTGSTAYNMSVGGPILEPTTSCMILSPVSPQSLNMRPLVVSDDSTLSITTHSRAPHYQVSIDGETIVCSTGSTVTIGRAPFVAKVILPKDHNFALTLRHKLLWGTDQR